MCLRVCMFVCVCVLVNPFEYMSITCMYGMYGMLCYALNAKRLIFADMRYEIRAMRYEHLSKRLKTGFRTICLMSI